MKSKPNIEPKTAPAVGCSAFLGEWYDLTIMPPDNTEVLVWREHEDGGWCETSIYANGVFHTVDGYKHPEWVLKDVTHWWWVPRQPGSPCYPVTSSPNH